MVTSFRDPNGKTCVMADRVFRIVNREGTRELQSCLSSSVLDQFRQSNDLVSTSFLRGPAKEQALLNSEVHSTFAGYENASIVEHERIPFPSFPYEWPPEMLYAAAILTLDLADALVNQGLRLKDATPSNVLFRGPKPVFVDVLSFEKREPVDATWMAYAQFIRTFVFPLLLNRHFGSNLNQLLVSHRDGVEPEELLRLLGPIHRFRPPFLSLVSIPTWLNRTAERRTNAYCRAPVKDARKATYIFRRVLRNARRNLVNAEPTKARTSRWSDYQADNNHSPHYLAQKTDFIRDLITFCRPQRVLDVGCNTGTFSLLTARTGASVVAIDLDPVVIGELWRRADKEDLDILPLVVNLARPTPSVGWRNQEYPSFLDRAKGQFDTVLMLGILHHLLVTEQIPLTLIVELAADLTTDLLAIEFVPPDDPKFRQIARGRDQLYANLTRDSFKQTCSRYFDIVGCRRLDHTNRYLYLMKRKDAPIRCFETQQ